MGDQIPVPRGQGSGAEQKMHGSSQVGEMGEQGSGGWPHCGRKVPDRWPAPGYGVRANSPSAATARLSALYPQPLLIELCFVGTGCPGGASGPPSEGEARAVWASLEKSAPLMK